MRGFRWLLIGAVVGVLIALGHVPFLAGAARSLAATALAIVSSGGRDLTRSATSAGVPKRIVLGTASVVGDLAPGVTAMLLILAARGTLRLRAIVALLLVVIGAASFAYHPSGVATGTVLLALAVAMIAVAATGPFVAAPLAALAGLIAGTYLPAMVLHARVPATVVDELHRAVYDRPGQPFVMRLILVVVALLPFLIALRLTLGRRSATRTRRLAHR